MYSNTQIGTVILVSLGIGLGVCTAAGFTSSWHPWVLITMGILVMALVLFGSLTVQVGARAVRCAFGPGLIHRTIPLERIAAARAVQTHWYFGWGIRLTPSGWLWNVSGLRAVELEYESGKRFLIGSPEPEAVVAAIERAKAGSS